jgi:L-threonylcarbamoyladenylate synthase
MAAALARAVRALADGDLVVYPTDTLFGLAARATDAHAVARLIQAKGRSADQPISLAVSSTEEIEPWADLTPARRAAVRDALPGPVTALLPASALARRRLAPGLIAPTGSLGVRVPDHSLARELARRAGPITATSANRHGAPAARSVAAARRALGPSVAVYLDGPPRPTGTPSTLLDLTGARPRRVERS